MLAESAQVKGAATGKSQAGKVHVGKVQVSKTMLAKELGIARSSLYYEPKKAKQDEEVKQQIESVWVKHPGYGHKRLAITLKLNKKRILRVMHKFGIKPYRRRVIKRPRKVADEGKAAVSRPNVVNVFKLLCPIAANVVWVSDFTYIKYRGRFIYVATIMDMYTREIGGVAVSRYHDTDLILEAFDDAMKQTKKRPQYLHSDQGSEYTSERYGKRVTNVGITMSFSDKGSPWQNGYQESFYGKFKVDLGDVNQYENLGELVAAIYDTMSYYNEERMHTALNMSPKQFKKLWEENLLKQIV